MVIKKTAAVLFLALLIYPATRLFSETPLTVTRVIDGDTLQLSNGETVRLIGIDCEENDYSPAEAAYLNRGKKWERGPESLKHAKEAAEFTQKLVQGRLVEGKQVRLEYDVQKKDKYGRTLAYVFIDLLDGKGSPPELDYKTPANWYTDFYGDKFSLFVNATLIKAGYAQAMTPSATDASADSAKTASLNVKYQDLFVKLEKEARENKRGLWND